MFLKNIKIQNFRNYKLLNVDFYNGINIIYGKNGQGKTNLLEAIYVLSITKSHKSFIDTKLIMESENFFKIKGLLNTSNINKKLEINMTEKNKVLKIDEIIKNKLSDYTSVMNVIIFYPEDLEIIKGSPILRRKYINTQLSQIDNSYLDILNEYNKLLKMRNDYLKQINYNIHNQIYLKTLNDYYIKKSILLYKMRKKYIEKVNERISDIYYDISGLKNLKVIYKSNIDFNYDNNDDLYNKIINKIDSVYETEKKLKTTLVGPNRDDFEFYIDDKNIKLFGSQGQQRMAILAFKLAEIEIFKNVKNEYPILLLDDVFSELDKNKKNNLLKYINNNIQTFITTTDLTSISKKLRNKAKLFEIESGKIKKIEEVKVNE